MSEPTEPFWFGIVIGCGALLIALALMIDPSASAEPSPVACERKTYACETGRVIDGDTFEAVCDLGLGVLRSLTVRVAEIDTPEVYGSQREPKRGKAATAATMEWLDMRGRRVVLEDMGRGKYGRQVMRVTSASGESLANHLRLKGHQK